MDGILIYTLYTILLCTEQFFKWHKLIPFFPFFFLQIQSTTKKPKEWKYNRSRKHKNYTKYAHRNQDVFQQTFKFSKRSATFQHSTDTDPFNNIFLQIFYIFILAWCCTTKLFLAHFNKHSHSKKKINLLFIFLISFFFYFSIFFKFFFKFF